MKTKKKEAVDFQRLPLGGDSWTRTNDPIDVNDVLYRLSHATLTLFPCYDFQLDIWTSSSYRLSHATTFRTPRPTSSVGHLEQFVLPTEPTDHFREQSVLYHYEGIRSRCFFPER